MANAEMWDYLAEVTADYTITELTVIPQNVIVEDMARPQVRHFADDGSFETVTMSATPTYYVTLQYVALSASDGGLIVDMFNDPNKANAFGRSFYWTHYGESSQHSYTVKFSSGISRSKTPVAIQDMSVTLLVLGRKPA